MNGGFNPRPAPKCRATGAGHHLGRGAACFNPRPAPKCRATVRVRSSPPPPGGFNPRPAPKCRATPAAGRHRLLRLVSIHAPHRSAGRPEGAGLYHRDSGGFNPRPAPKCRATSVGSGRKVEHAVSIHAPHRSAGRHGNGAGLNNCEMQFQSTPRTEVQGDRMMIASLGTTLWFHRSALTPLRNS